MINLERSLSLKCEDMYVHTFVSLNFHSQSWAVSLSTEARK